MSDGPPPTPDRGVAPDAVNGGPRPVDPLEDVYDPATLGRIERASTGGRAAVGERWRSVSVASAITGASLTGLAEVLEPAEDHVGQVHPEAHDHRLEPVTVHFVPHDPRATVAVIRPWLLGRRAGGWA